MDERQADRIIALLESIKTNTRDTDIAINGIASDISKIASVIYDIKHETERFRQIAEDVNTIRAIIVGVLWWLGILFVFKYLGTYFIENPLF